MTVERKLTSGQVKALRVFNEPKGAIVRTFSTTKLGPKRKRQQAAHGVVMRLVKKGLLYRNGHGFYKTTADGRKALNRLAAGK